MKKIIALVLTFILIFGLVGCTKKTYELPYDQFCYTINNSQTLELKIQDKEYIVDLLNEALWINNISSCGFDYVFYLQKQEVRYHSECGTFNDITNEKSTTVSEAQRTAINTILGVN